MNSAQLKFTVINFSAFLLHVLFTVIVAITFSMFFPIYAEQAVVLRDELNVYQSAIPQIDPNNNDELQSLETSLSQVDPLVHARNTILISSGIVFIFLLLVNSVIFTLQRKLFDKKQSFKKTFLTFTIGQLAVFVCSFIFLLFATFLAAQFALIENQTLFYLTFGILAIVYSYIFVLLYVQKKSLMKRAIKIHTVFVLIGFVLAFTLFHLLQTAAENAFDGILFFIIGLLGLALASYEKYLLFRK